MKANWSKICDWTDAVIPESLNDTLSVLMDNIERSQKEAAAGGSAGGDSGLKADMIFNMMAAYLD